VENYKNDRKAAREGRKEKGGREQKGKGRKKAEGRRGKEKVDEEESKLEIRRYQWECGKVRGGKRGFSQNRADA
jgi:hypothetical protein